MFLHADKSLNFPSHFNNTPIWLNNLFTPITGRIKQEEQIREFNHRETALFSEICFR